MRVVKCTFNHFYDADKYDVCPQCGAGINVAETNNMNKASSREPVDNKVFSTNSTKSGATFGVFKNKAASMISRKSKSDNTAKAGNYEKLKSFNPKPDSNTDKQMFDSNSLLNTPSNGQLEPEIVTEPVMDITRSPFKPLAQPVTVEPDPVETPSTLNEPVVHNREINNSVVTPEAELPVQNSVSTPSVESADSEESLFNEVKKAAADNDGKTVGFFSMARPSAAPSDESDNTPQPVIPSEEPVVGWLVCIEGPNIGQSFNIHAGQNSLGRSNNNTIVINKDKSVSREKHAWIVYEPKHRQFYAQPGESSGLTYVNDEVIMQATKLEKWSVIDVGNTRLTLFPLCDDEFSWENYL